MFIFKCYEFWPAHAVAASDAAQWNRNCLNGIVKFLMVIVVNIYSFILIILSDVLVAWYLIISASRLHCTLNPPQEVNRWLRTIPTSWAWIKFKVFMEWINECGILFFQFSSILNINHSNYFVNIQVRLTTNNRQQQYWFYVNSRGIWVCLQ